jgi:hypothetical protein
MKPEEIELESMTRLFEYEKHSRVIDSLDTDELRNYAKLYCKMYLKQQEVINLISQSNKYI